MFDGLNNVIIQVTKLDVLIVAISYIFIISTIASFAVYLDKQFAIKEKRRISEKTLFILGFLGGALVEFWVMQIIRHKTQHKRFMIGLPVIFCVQIPIFIGWLATWFR